MNNVSVSGTLISFKQRCKVSIILLAPVWCAWVIVYNIRVLGDPWIRVPISRTLIAFTVSAMVLTVKWERPKPIDLHHRLSNACTRLVQAWIYPSFSFTLFSLEKLFRCVQDSLPSILLCFSCAIRNPSKPHEALWKLRTLQILETREPILNCRTSFRYPWSISCLVHVW